jgi:predicted HicB family RNase H-like nuclease
MSTTNRYAYRAEWSPEDDEYVGLVAEFPSLSWLAPTAGEAIAGAERLVDDILADMAETGEVPPVPFIERRYSGNISFRTSPDHHRRLAIAAAEQGVSINQWMVQRLLANEPPKALPEEVLAAVRREVQNVFEEAQGRSVGIGQALAETAGVRSGIDTILAAGVFEDSIARHIDALPAIAISAVPDTDLHLPDLFLNLWASPDKVAKSG